MTEFLLLAGEAAAQQGSTAQLLSMILPIALIFVVFYFFLIRPEKKRKKEITSMRDSLKVGDTITTIGGIVGKITNVNDKEDLITIETGADKTKIRITRWAVGTKEEKADDKAKDDKKIEAPAEDAPEEKKD